MATTAMVTTSRIGDWFGSWDTNSVRFCKNGHEVPTHMGFDFPPDKCLECGCPLTVTFHGQSDTIIPVPHEPVAFERKWKPVEAYDKEGSRLSGVRQRVRVPVFDVSRVPLGAFGTRSC
jgi:hypothetical protein